MAHALHGIGPTVLALLLAGSPARAQMVVGPQSLPRPGEETETLPGIGPVVREAPAPGLAVNIDTGTTAGIYHAAGAAICRLLARSPSGEGVACTALYSAGSAQNIPDLKQGKVNFAIVQSDVQYFAYRGEQVFDDLGPTPELRHVATLQAEALTVVAARSSGILTASDIYGKRVNLGQLGSGTFVIREMLATVDPRIETITAVPDLKTALSADALCLERIDAFAFVAGNPNPLVQQATRQCGGRLVPIVGPVPDKLLATYPFYSRVTIPGGLYPNNPEPTPTVGVHATLVTRADVPTDLVRRVTEALYTGLDEFRRLHLAFTGFTRETLAAACNTAPLHEGAARYLKEAGIEPGPCPR
jgi:hypothetical protein